MVYTFFRAGIAQVNILFIVLACFVLISPTYGQVMPEVDEEIQVYHLGGWKDGVVLEVEKKQVRASYTFISEKVGVFDRTKIRRMHEVDAIDFDRRWSSADGSFRVVAALKSYDDEKVKLIKFDLNEIEVPLARLSRNDRVYVKKVKRNIKTAISSGARPAETPDLPKIEQFLDSGDAVMSFTTFGESNVSALGSTPDFLKTFTQQGVGFRKKKASQDLVSVIPVGGPEQLVLMTFLDEGGSSRETQFPSVLYWVSMSEKKVVGTVNITHQAMPFDYDPKAKRLVTFSRERGHGINEPPHYTVWELEPKSTQAKPIIRWESKLSWARTPYAKVISENIVLVREDTKKYVAFDIVEKGSPYKFEQDSFFSAPVALTIDRKHLVIPEDGQIKILNTETGNVDFTLDGSGTSFSGANVNSDGTKLAGVNSNSIYVWDLTNAEKPPKIYPAPLVGSPFRSRIEWLDDDSVIVDGRRAKTLYRFSDRLPIWSYKMKREANDNDDPFKSMVIAGKLFYVAEPDRKSAAIGVVDLPGPRVNEIAGQIDRESLMIMKPGMPVAISASNISEPQVKDWLSEKVKANQWIEDPDAEIVLSAEMGRGKSTSITYQKFGNRSKTTINYTPYFAKLELKKGETVLWNSGSTSSPPHMIPEGSSIQKEVNERMVPQTQFFKHVKIDPKIIDPKYSRGFGVSGLGLKGITVTSTTPPGRSADPMMDAQKDLKEREEKAKASGDAN